MHRKRLPNSSSEILQEAKLIAFDLLRGVGA